MNNSIVCIFWGNFISVCVDEKKTKCLHSHKPKHTEVIKCFYKLITINLFDGYFCFHFIFFVSFYLPSLLIVYATLNRSECTGGGEAIGVYQSTYCLSFDDIYLFVFRFTKTKWTALKLLTIKCVLNRCVFMWVEISFSFFFLFIIDNWIFLFSRNRTLNVILEYIYSLKWSRTAVSHSFVHFILLLNDVCTVGKTISWLRHNGIRNELLLSSLNYSNSRFFSYFFFKLTLIHH